MPASYRPLLPREPESTPNGGAGASSSDPQSPHTRQPRKKHNPAACESCRKRKIRVMRISSMNPLLIPWRPSHRKNTNTSLGQKCTGERPACAPCVRRGHASKCNMIRSRPKRTAKHPSESWRQRMRPTPSTMTLSTCFDLVR